MCCFRKMSSNTHTVEDVMDVTSLMTKYGHVCVCACVCVRDTLSQQMYVISFRGWSGEGKPERRNKMNEQMKESFRI